MRVRVRVRDTTVLVDVGPGHQRLKWLTMVALQRYSEESLVAGDETFLISQSNVATGLMDERGTLLPPNQSIRVALVDGQEVFALLQCDEVHRKGSKGTSVFLMSQGAAPNKCVINGASVTYALAGHPIYFYITARDTYGNLARNGGELFTVKISAPDNYTQKQLEQLNYSADEAPKIEDRSDGSYIVSYQMRLKGRYEISVQLDGEPIAGSPFTTVAVKTNVPPLIKWLQPRIGGAEMPRCSHAVCCAYGRTIIHFGGIGNLKPTLPEDIPFFGELLMLHIERLKWEVPKVSGQPPSPRGGCTSVLAGHRLFIFGGLVDVDGPPSDELWSLDMEMLQWTNIPIRGVSPGRLAYSAAAAVGNKCFFYGGYTGEEAVDKMYVFDVVNHMWEPVEENQAGPNPPARFGHSLIAMGSKLIMYGGRDLHRHYSTLCIFDTETELWSHPATRGDVCRERAFHTACVWGRNMLIALGYDGSNTSNIVSVLDLDSMYWDSSWDGNLVRTGSATALVEGKLYVVGGEDLGDKYRETYQFNMGGFMMEFDGVDDEIVIPHLPTIIPDRYTIEAWVKPARVGPMNIVARSDESSPLAAWSHQLRINAQGRLEHYCEADEKYTVSHTVPVTAGVWYHVAGVTTGEEMKLIVDGQEEGQSVDIGPLRQKLDRYFVGSASGDNMAMFEGSIAELRVWNQPLSEDTIREQMRKVLTGTERGLVGYWRINEGPGGMVFDSSSYGNFGPIHGEPQWTANMVPVHE
ncbi:hypothetical protein AB1Y20_020334 [Prymnesium parvum]|uniref:LamG-like jellyroll fold domain-containing protein n=1 Tax=Prymnesium parvum TaxID=97485 RepID=A0AB34JWT4_PRYPA